jgi:hypothetical protein
MANDDQIEELRERHEALTQTIELMVLENREREASWNQRFLQMAELLKSLAEATGQGVRVVESHQHRLDSLEGNA